MNLAKKFVLGAVYAVQCDEGDDWEPCVCTRFDRYGYARLVIMSGGYAGHEYSIEFDLHAVYRIRARDWEGGKWGSLGAPELEPDPAAFFAFFGIDRSVSGVRLSGLYKEIYGGLVTPFVYGPTCTCGIGAAPSRKHWASCPVKQEIER